MDASALRSARRWEAGPKYIWESNLQVSTGVVKLQVYGVNYLRDEDDPRGG